MTERELINIVREIVCDNGIDQEVGDYIINSFVLTNKLNELGGLDEFCTWVGELCND